MKKGFIYLDEAVQGIRWDAKYAGCDNFTGRPVDGYEINRVVGTAEMAAALCRALKRAAALGYGLLVWDAYRPQRAVDCFLKWAMEPEDGLTKAEHYPNIAREEMFSQGYVVLKSSHSRGSAIDLTLCDIETGEPVPMGTCFDFMDEKAHHSSTAVTAKEAANRQMLRFIMEQSGFEAYENEWWHYLLHDEPYPDQYFDFPVV